MNPTGLSTEKLQLGLDSASQAWNLSISGGSLREELKASHISVSTSQRHEADASPPQLAGGPSPLTQPVYAHTSPSFLLVHLK